MEIAGFLPLEQDEFQRMRQTEISDLKHEFGAELEKVYSEFKRIRLQTEKLCEPLHIEDYGVQSIPEVSPPKWHLGHTSWFFDEFILKEFSPDYRIFNDAYSYFFNSYYESTGKRIPKERRGTLSRPLVREIKRYRTFVDEQIEETIDIAVRAGAGVQTLTQRMLIGMHHEQQHQELLLMDIKHNFGENPLKPSYLYRNPLRIVSKYSEDTTRSTRKSWIKFSGGLHEVGHSDRTFSYDNENPRHKVYLKDFCLQSHPVTNGEYIEFIEAGGYENPLYWLSDGWAYAQKSGWTAPLYWEKTENQWRVMTLSGMRPLLETEPVVHLSYYEADAYARWKGCRLPTEFEWEVAATKTPIAGNFMDAQIYHPTSLDTTSTALPSKTSIPELAQIWGDVWEWTSSPYQPYPGFRPTTGALGEYNGKFMSNQFVLRGGSCVTPESHLRPTYRNFYYPHNRWQFSGLRLAL